jgi:hypothetical protein
MIFIVRGRRYLSVTSRSIAEGREQIGPGRMYCPRKRWSCGDQKKHPRPDEPLSSELKAGDRCGIPQPGISAGGLAAGISTVVLNA